MQFTSAVNFRVKESTMDKYESVDFLDDQTGSDKVADRITNVRYPIGSVVIVGASPVSFGTHYNFLNNRPLIVIGQQTQMFNNLTCVVCTTKDHPGVKINLHDYRFNKWLNDKQETVACPYSIVSIRIDAVKYFLGCVDPYTLKAIQDAMLFHLGISTIVPPYMSGLYEKYLKPEYNMGTIENTQYAYPHPMISERDSRYSYNYSLNRPSTKTPESIIENTKDIISAHNIPAATGAVSDLVFPDMTKTQEHDIPEEDTEIPAIDVSDTTTVTQTATVVETIKPIDSPENFVNTDVHEFCGKFIITSEGMRINREIVYDGFRFWMNRTHRSLIPRDEFEKHLIRELGRSIYGDGTEDDSNIEYWYGFNLTKEMCDLLNTEYNTNIILKRRSENKPHPKAVAGPTKKDFPEEIKSFLRSSFRVGTPKDRISYQELRDYIQREADAIGVEIPPKIFFKSAFLALFPKTGYTVSGIYYYTHIKYTDKALKRKAEAENTKKEIEEAAKAVEEADSKKAEETPKPKTRSRGRTIQEIVADLSDKQKVAILSNTYKAYRSTEEAESSGSDIAFSAQTAIAITKYILASYNDFIDHEFASRIGTKPTNVKFFTDTDVAVLIFHTNFDKLYIKPNQLKPYIREFCKKYGINIANKEIRKTAVSSKTISEIFKWEIV